jgi:hypothetical protein
MISSEKVMNTKVVELIKIYNFYVFISSSNKVIVNIIH